jgi:DNA-binding FadR family transcriptional regulator
MNSTVTLSNNRVEPVAQGVARRILEGEYVPGPRLPTESEMQMAWGVSRSVVREAMKMLASQGLVRIEQGRGTFVNDLPDAPLSTQLELTLRRSAPHHEDGAESLEDWAHLLDVRRVLEVAVAERAAEQASADDLAAMEAAIAAMHEKPDEPTGYIDADLAFHRALAAATGNPLWSALLNSLNDLLRRYREAGFRGAGSALSAARQHEEILQAVRAGDAVAAAAAMREHLRKSEQDLQERADAKKQQQRAAKGVNEQ